MNATGEVREFRRRSRSEADRIVNEFEESGLGRKEFCAARGLSVHTLDAWRRRASQQTGVEKIVPVELVESCDSVRGRGSVQQRGQLRVVLSSGLRIEVEAGFDGAELQRLIAALESTVLSGRMTPAV